ncbi:CWC16 protein, partial [Hyaloraphidium curvatum]
MSERKVINKYFPPDFDPSKIGRRKGPKNSQHKVRLMAPFSMNCRTCGNWIAKSTKFNARKENVKDMDYLGIRIFRFYIRCPRCSAEITFRTDPQNTDYVCEQGAVRNFEPWKDSSLTEDELKEQRAKDEENNPMKALENRTMESKREMDILDALDEIRTRNAMNERVDPEGLLEKLMEKKRKDTEEAYAVLLEQLLDEEDDAYARSIF